MADPGCAFLGAVISKVLDEVLDALKDLKDRDRNLQELEFLLQRLQPFVRNMQGSAQDESIQLASQWLSHLQKQLEMARNVIQSCTKAKMGVCFRVGSSRKFKMLYENIWRLLAEAPLAQWAATLSTNIKFRDDVAVIKEVQEKLILEQEKEERVLKIAEAVTFGPSSFRTRETKRAVSEQIAAIHSQNNALPASTPSFSAPSSSALLRENQHGYWNRDSETSEPVVSFGGDAIAQQLIADLVNPERYRKWIGLWAMGGAGKTFTARKIYNDDRIRNHFTGGMFWVTVSQEQPSIYTLLKELSAHIGGEGVSKFPDSLWDARNLLEDQLAREKVLLILDDVWDPHTLEDLDLISADRKCVILVTSRDDTSLRNAMDSDGIIQIPPLSKEDSWKLFSWHAFFAHKRNVPSDLEDVARAVADECKGLPLALQVIGSSMANVRLLDREVRHLGKSLRQEWEDSLEKLKRASIGKDQYETLYRRLQLSVDNLKKEDPRLQDCFLYFAAFPEDFKVEINMLVTIWIAGGILGNGQENLFSREKEGLALVGLLISKSMIELVPEGDINMCRIHDVMRVLAYRNLKWKVGEKQDLVKIEPSKRRCLFAPGSKLEKFPDEWINLGTGCSVERLSLHSNDLEQLPDQFNASNLRVLLLTGNYRIQALPPGFFMSLSQLTVLDLSETSIKKISAKVLRSLKSLVLLNLTGCGALQKISNRIKDLHNLHSIILDECDILEKLPRMKNLLKLHTLSMLQDENEFVGATARLDHFVFRLTGDMDDFPNLRLKYDLRLRHEIHKVLQLRNLKRLTINAYKWPLSDVSPLVALEDLGIKANEFPKGILKLQNLKTLKVWEFHGSSIPALEKLPLLESLVIKGVGRHIAFPESFGHSGAFPSLKKMDVEELDGVEISTLYHGAMPRIQRLKMRSSPDDDIHVPRSLTALGSSLTFLHIAGECNAINLEEVFSEPKKFSNLEYLEFRNVYSLPETIAALPRLRWLGCGSEKVELPQNLEQLVNQGKVKMV